MYRASIDIGTNSVLLLIAEQTEKGLQVLEEAQRLPRLGSMVDSNRLLAKESMNKVLEALSEYVAIIQKYGNEVLARTVVTATSAVRDAANKQEFLTLVKETVGFQVLILSGEEEAKYTYLGAISQTKVESDSIMIVDIGGGSTELAVGNSTNLLRGISINMGSVRFNERFLLHNPPYQREIGECRRSIEALLRATQLHFPSNIQVVAVSGTATSLAAIDQQLYPYRSSGINNYRLNNDKLATFIRLFSIHTFEYLLDLHPEVMKGRVDVFLAGLLILEGVLRYARAEEFIVSNGGIRHGILLS
ncbi:MAG: Ppx/GppA phosphatase family protein [Bacteroidota bacterium]|nr:Ppx/GppA phosphatase family protein [Bacteroidota bacterium]